MITFIFSVMMIAVFGRLAVFALRMTWGVLKVVSCLFLLPAIIIWAFVKGLFKIAFPVLAIVGLISLLTPKKEEV